MGGRSRTRRSMAFLFAGVLALVPTAVGALGTGEPLTQEDLEAGLSDETLEAILATEPLSALALLGVGEFGQRLIPFLGLDVGQPQEYAFGDDPEAEPVLEVPGTRLAVMGVVQVLFDEVPPTPPGVTDEHVFVVHGDGIVLGEGYTLMWARYHDAYDLTSMETFANRGFVTALPDVPLWESAFAGDVWWGGHQMPGLRSDDLGDGLEWFMEMIRYDPEHPFVFVAVEFDGFALLSGDLFVVGVATSDLVGEPPPISGLRGMPLHSPEDLRFGYYSHERPSGTPLFTQGHITTFPEVPDRGFDDLFDAFDYDLFILGWDDGSGRRWGTVVGIPDRVAQEAQPTTTTTMLDVSPTTLTDPADDVAEESGTSFTNLLLFVLLVAVAIFLLWLLWQRFITQRREGESGDPYRFGPTRARPPPDEEKGEDPYRFGGTRTRGVKPEDDPTLYGGEEEEEEHTACGWGLYFVGPQGVTTPIREPAPGEHLCCEYTVSVITDVTAHVQTARGRQDAGAERLQIPDFDYGWSALDLVANASARSGPAGKLDWMQGLGDPTDLDGVPVDDHWQQGNEPPEVAAHLTHVEKTTVHISLKAGCPQYKNLYSASAASSLDLLATHECTNNAGDPCPVELNAFGYFGGWVMGPGNLSYIVDDWTDPDPDELERSPLVEELTRAGSTPHAPVDAHDHVTRDRVAYEVAKSDSASDALEQDDLLIDVNNIVRVDAGQIVPAEVYGTTERVSAHIEGDLKHDLQIRVNLTPLNCEQNNCGGHGACNCHGQWEMRVSGVSGSSITADAGAKAIVREPPADRQSPFTGSGYPWKVEG